MTVCIYVYCLCSIATKALKALNYKPAVYRNVCINEVVYFKVRTQWASRVFVSNI